MVLVPMTEADEIIAEVRELPLKDAAFLLWRECSKLDLLAWRAMPPELRKNITRTYYPAGHMMYHDPASRRKLHEDVAGFIRAEPPESR